MPEIAVTIANTIISLMPYIIATFIVIAIILFLVRRKGRKEEDEMEKPPIIEPEEKFIDQHKNLLRNYGHALKFKSMLKFGIQPTSYVKRWMLIYLPKEPVNLKNNKKSTKKKYDGEIKVMEEQIANLKSNNIDTSKVDNDLNLLKKIIEEEPKEQIENHYILETLQPGIINRLLYLFGYRMNFMIIPIGLVNTINSSNWNLPIDASITPFFDRIYYLDTAGKKYMHEFHDELTLKQVLKNQVNYIPQMQYHDFVTGKYAAKSREHYAAKHRAWKQHEENLEKEPEQEEEESLTD